MRDMPTHLDLASPHAYTLGQIAHEQGRKAIPWHDPALLDWVLKWSTVKGSCVVILNSWSEGWHAANLAKSQ